MFRSKQKSRLSGKPLLQSAIPYNSNAKIGEYPKVMAVLVQGIFFLQEGAPCCCCEFVVVKKFFAGTSARVVMFAKSFQGSRDQ